LSSSLNEFRNDNSLITTKQNNNVKNIYIKDDPNEISIQYKSKAPFKLSTIVINFERRSRYIFQRLYRRVLDLFILDDSDDSLFSNFCDEML